VSGFGSSVAGTAELRKELSEFIQRRRIQSLIDAPCGDFNWMKMVLDENEQLSYLGMDIVEELVESNSSLYGRSSVRFAVGDILIELPGEADMWLCRDIIIHLPNKEIEVVLNKARAAPIKYFATTYYPDISNAGDISFGEFKRVNVCADPFYWPAPDFILKDNCDDDSGRHLGIWGSAEGGLRRMATSVTPKICGN
jgi:hypothetical protein